MIQNASDVASDTEAASRYRALSAAGSSVDAETASLIAKLDTPKTDVNSETGAVVSRCRALGYPPTQSQIEQLEALLIARFGPSTTAP